MDTPSAAFEARARVVLSAALGVSLIKRKLQLPGKTLREFDGVSTDGSIVMDAKHLTWGVNQPAAKLADISQLVLHLIHVDSDQRIVVCGNDRRVPIEWLRRWGGLAAKQGVEFYFLGQSDLELLNPQRVDT
jgi:hypothetical protein